MAKRLPDGNEQATQQSVEQSPWDWKPLGERLAQRMVRELEPDTIWVIDDTGFPKQSEHSVGVARQYSGTLGKTANCQVAVSLHEVCSQGPAALNWAALFAGELNRRREAAIWPFVSERSARPVNLQTVVRAARRMDPRNGLWLITPQVRVFARSGLALYGGRDGCSAS